MYRREVSKEDYMEEDRNDEGNMGDGRRVHEKEKGHLVEDKE